jgi:hypothetical protein
LNLLPKVSPDLRDEAFFHPATDDGLGRSGDGSLIHEINKNHGSGAWVVILFFEEIANFLEKVCIFAPIIRN